jgi:hypothetical protein
MQRSRKQWKEIVPYRLDDVYEGVIRKDHPSTVIRSLRSSELISKNYDITCLAVDVWCLFDRKPSDSKRKSSEFTTIKDPLIRVFFGIVVQAIYDVSSGRPCDVNSWIVDIPPMGSDLRCSPSVHVCHESAAEFMEETGALWEAVLNLPAGMLAELSAKENGSEGSRSQAILNCTGQ